MKILKITLVLKNNRKIDNIIEKIAKLFNLKIGEMMEESYKDSERIILEEIYKEY